jgi:hypothetical protein
VHKGLQLYVSQLRKLLGRERLDQAVRLWEQKGNVVAATHARERKARAQRS